MIRFARDYCAETTWWCSISSADRACSPPKCTVCFNATIPIYRESGCSRSFDMGRHGHDVASRFEFWPCHDRSGFESLVESVEAEKSAKGPLMRGGWWFGVDCRRLCDFEFGYRGASDFLLESEHTKCTSTWCQPESGGSGDSEGRNGESAIIGRIWRLHRGISNIAPSCSSKRLRWTKRLITTISWFWQT